MRRLTPLLTAWMGLTMASPVILPQKSHLHAVNATENGILDWGLASSPKANTHMSDATSEMRLGESRPELDRPFSSANDSEASQSKVLGDLFGAFRKTGQSTTNHSQLSADDASYLHENNGDRNSSDYIARLQRKKRYKNSKVGSKGRVAGVIALEVLSPSLKEVLQAMKEWDNPIGRFLTWFDDMMASMQEAIGGQQVSGIPGNELQLWLICLLKEEDPTRPTRSDRACAERRIKLLEAERRQKEQDIIARLDQVLEECERAEDEPPTDDSLRSRLLERCRAFGAKVTDVEYFLTRLIDFREQVRAKVGAGGQIVQEDIDTAAKYLKHAGLSASDYEGTRRARDLATWYLDEVKSARDAESTAPNEPEQAWAALPQLAAGSITEDGAAAERVMQALSSTPYQALFETASLQGTEPCWSPAGLERTQPSAWDEVSAALVYVDSLLRASRRTCRACQKADAWILRCGSVVV